MARLRMMRAPQKYVQGKDSLFKFHEEMKDLGNKFLFVCSRSGYKMCHDKIEKMLHVQDFLLFTMMMRHLTAIYFIQRTRKLLLWTVM